MNIPSGRTLIIRVLLVLELVLGGLVSAHGTAVVRLFDGSMTLDIADNGGFDVDMANGSVMYAGTFGSWDVSLAWGMTKPFLGDAASPFLGMSMAVMGSGTLTLSFSETDFTGSGILTAATAGTADGTI